MSLDKCHARTHGAAQPILPDVFGETFLEVFTSVEGFVVHAKQLGSNEVVVSRAFRNETLALNNGKWMPP